MRKIIKYLIIILCFALLTGFRTSSNAKTFDIEELYDYQREYESYDVGVCSPSPVKSYESYRSIVATDSAQYWYIKNYMHVDEETGLLVDSDGFIGVALGSYYGSEIGTRYYVTLDTGVVLPLVLVDQKANKDTNSTNCYHLVDHSVIEFVIDPVIAKNYFNNGSKSVTTYGNFNYFAPFNGSIVRFEVVTDNRNEDYVTFFESESIDLDIDNIYFYASGY